MDKVVGGLERDELVTVNVSSRVWHRDAIWRCKMEFSLWKSSLSSLLCSASLRYLFCLLQEMSPVNEMYRSALIPQKGILQFITFLLIDLHVD